MISSDFRDFWCRFVEAALGGGADGVEAARYADAALGAMNERFGYSVPFDIAARPSGRRMADLPTTSPIRDPGEFAWPSFDVPDCTCADCVQRQHEASSLRPRPQYGPYPPVTTFGSPAKASDVAVTGFDAPRPPVAPVRQYEATGVDPIRGHTFAVHEKGGRYA